MNMRSQELLEIGLQYFSLRSQEFERKNDEYDKSLDLWDWVMLNMRSCDR